MPASPVSRPGPFAVRAATRPRRLVVAGLGHVGLGLACDAVAAGYLTVGFGPDPGQVLRLIDGLAADDVTAAALSTALARGRFQLSGDAGSCAPFDVAVVVPGPRPVDPADTTDMELSAVGLAPLLRRGALVVVGGAERPTLHGELFAATVELLTGMRAGHEYDLGFALSAPSAGPSDVTIVSGVDDRAARRTAALHRRLGRTAAVVTPAKAAELVALLQGAVARDDRRDGGSGS